VVGRFLFFSWRSLCFIEPFIIFGCGRVLCSVVQGQCIVVSADAFDFGILIFLFFLFSFFFSFMLVFFFFFFFIIILAANVIMVVVANVVVVIGKDAQWMVLKLSSKSSTMGLLEAHLNWKMGASGWYVGLVRARRWTRCRTSSVMGSSVLLVRKLWYELQALLDSADSRESATISSGSHLAQLCATRTRVTHLEL